MKDVTQAHTLRVYSVRPTVDDKTLPFTTEQPEDRLFATLDPLTREIDLGENAKLLLTDTVGFIRKLPQRTDDGHRTPLKREEPGSHPEYP